MRRGQLVPICALLALGAPGCRRGATSQAAVENAATATPVAAPAAAAAAAAGAVTAPAAAAVARAQAALGGRADLVATRLAILRQRAAAGASRGDAALAAQADALAASLAACRGELTRLPTLPAAERAAAEVRLRATLDGLVAGIERAAQRLHP